MPDQHIPDDYVLLNYIRWLELGTAADAADAIETSGVSVPGETSGLRRTGGNPPCIHTAAMHSCPVKIQTE